MLILDILHVLSYLWNAAYVFHAEGTEEARLWVRSRLLAILQGRVSSVVAGSAEAVLKARALDKSGDLPAYCNFHMAKENERLYAEWRLAA